MKLRYFALVLFGIATFAMATSPALAWWQFVAYHPNGERKVYTPFPTEKACQAELKKVDAQIEKEYPKLYPRVGSCEEYK